MAKRPGPSPYCELQAEIRRLRDDLYMARMAIIELMEPEARKLLLSFYSRPPEQSVWLWCSEVADKIVDQCAEAEQATYNGYPVGSPRAYCPLCKDGSSSFYEKGFALPLGLTRHLVGYGNMRQCDVMSAALALARSHEDG